MCGFLVARLQVAKQVSNLVVWLGVNRSTSGGVFSEWLSTARVMVSLLLCVSSSARRLLVNISMRSKSMSDSMLGSSRLQRSAWSLGKREVNLYKNY